MPNKLYVRSRNGLGVYSVGDIVSRDECPTKTICSVRINTNMDNASQLHRTEDGNKNRTSNAWAKIKSRV